MDKISLKIISILDDITMLIRIAMNPILPPISKLESKILETIYENTIDEYIGILKNHLDCINVVRREGTEDEEIYFYNIKGFGGYWNWKRDRYFDTNIKRQKLAHFDIYLENGKRIKGTLFARDGILSHIHLDIHTTKYRKIRNNRTITVEIKPGFLTQKKYRKI